MLELRYTPGDAPRFANPNFSDAPPDPRAGLFAGYQLARVSFGVGLELARSGWKNESQSNGTESGNHVTTYFVMPGLRAALGRSRDGRAEVIGVVDVGWGETTYTSDDGFSDPVTYDRFRFQLGPGLRYWPVSSLGFGATALVRHDRVHFEDPFSDFTQETTSTDLAMSLSATGVF